MSRFHMPRLYSARGGGMTTATAIPVQQNTPAWLDARRDLVGASDVPIITGTAAWGSIFSLWADKTRLAEPEVPDDETQELFDIGHALEPVIAERYTAKTGRPVKRVNRLLRHPSVTYMGASLDRVSAVRGERRIVELKYAAHRRWSEGADPVPAHVQDQVQAQMFVSGFPVADVAVLNGGRVDVFTIEADQGYQEDLLFLVYEKLWKYVESGQMPPVDGSDATKGTLTRLAERRALANGTRIAATPELDVMARDLRDAQERRKAAERIEGTLKNAIGALLIGAKASSVAGDGWRIDWNKNADTVRTVIDHAGIAGAYRRLLETALEQQDPTIRGALRDAGLDPDAPDLLDAIEQLHTRTETKAGARPMRLWWKGDDGRWV